MSITYVGGQVGGRAGATSTTNITYALTGGSNSTPQAGDLVVITCVVASQARTPACAITAPGTWTNKTQINANGTTYDTSLNVSYKFMPGTPDTTFTLPSTGNTADAQRYAVHVFRGVDTSSPEDVAAVTASGTGTGRPDPGAITPTTSGAYVLICGGGAAATGASYTAPANYATNFRTGSTADTNDAMVGAGYRAWTSGAEDPAAYTGGTTNAVDSWACYTLALRPQGAVTHATTGALVGQGSTITGSASRVGDGGAIVQSVESHDYAQGGSLAVTITGVTSGNALVAFIGYDSFQSNANNVASVNDGSAYTAAADGRCENTTMGQASEVWYLPNASSGSHTVTATFNNTDVPYRRLRVVEVSGVATSSPEDGASHQAQDGVGSTTDSISSSATGTTSNANDFVLGLTQNCSDDYGGSPPTVSAGTGFTIGSGTDKIMVVEGKNVTSVGAQTATFTAGGNQSWTTHVLVLKTAATGPVTHSTSGALTGSGATITGAGARFRAHAATGALVGPGSTIAGAAARSTGAVTHDTSGALVGSGSEVSGSATRFRAFASTGAIVGAGSTVSGVATRFRAHPSTGALTGQGATVSGSANRYRAHGATGALVGSGAALSGTAQHNVPHSTSGALVGQGSTITGAAARNTSAVSHDTSGVLVGQGPAITGSAARTRQHDASGSLVGQGASLSATAARFRAFATAGALVGQGSEITGSARRNSPHDATGALVGQGAIVAGGAARSGAAVTITGLSLDLLREIWARLELDPDNPVIITAENLQFGTVTQTVGAGGATRTGATLASSKNADEAILEIWRRLGLDPANPLVQTATTIDAGPVHCTVTEVGGTVTVQRA